MSAVVQTRLDAAMQARLKKLVKRTNLTPSEVLREGLVSLEMRLDDAERSTRKPLRLTGAGGFDSGVTDLATNKKHMEGFGKKWRVDNQGKGRWDW